MANWFSKNLKKLKKQKCHFMLYGENSNEHRVNIGPALIKECIEEKPLGVIFYKELSLETNVQQLCTKTS